MRKASVLLHILLEVFACEEIMLGWEGETGLETGASKRLIEAVVWHPVMKDSGHYLSLADLGPEDDLIPLTVLALYDNYSSWSFLGKEVNRTPRPVSAPKTYLCKGPEEH
ncbi:hypothetical protein H920_06314 [Fukomys damarensis]|uniref:Uncharacterized protein n=1 Tax=Fukomys damarensis TaxID=885580 RepID=A0A091EAG6_FUKDA|nr:hypothetical protein H920_06314 [Fukomys damarensis]